MAKKKLNVGLIGCGFMGKAHSNAYLKVAKFFDVPFEPVMKVLCDTNADKAQTFADNWGWQEIETDWRKMIARDDIDIVDICTPNNTHHDIVMACAEAGKIMALEKPLAMNVAEGREMLAATEKAGKPNMVWFNYRRVPAAALAKQIIDSGKLGRIFHYRAKYLQDYTISPDVPQGGDALWRLDAKVAGSGVTGDLLAHSIDMATWFIGPIARVSAMTEIFVKERVMAGQDKKMPVTIDDACAFLARFENGALGTFESTRYACGRKNQNTFEVNGEHGSLAFDLETAHELEYFDHSDDISIRGWRTIQTWDSKHPYMKNWWVPGCGIGYEHWHINALADFLDGLGSGEKTCPDFKDALATQIVCDSVIESARQEKWVDIEKP